MYIAFPIQEYRVVDGDTVEVAVNTLHRLEGMGHTGSWKTSVRLEGVDAPEVRRPASDLEIEAGVLVAKVVEDWLAERVEKGLSVGWDDTCPWGRLVGDLYSLWCVEVEYRKGKRAVSVDAVKRGSLAHFLQSKGLVHTTTHKRHDWKEDELKDIITRARGTLNESS